MTVAPRQLGPYRLGDPLGQGATGIVYRARHVDTGSDVAVKTVRGVDPADYEGLRREMHVLSRLRHPGVVRVLAYGVKDGLPWYAMEFVEGTTLEELWAQEVTATPVSMERLAAPLAIMRRFCMTLAFLHGEGIVHRDLKPGNVVVRSDARPVLIDFGLVSRFGGPVGREALEAGGEILGTFAYIAPEQARGEYVDARADLYSLGCMLYEIVSGRVPFIGTALDVLQQHLAVEPVPPSERNPELSPQLDALILRLMEKDPRRRLGYAIDVAAVLGQLVPAESVDDFPPARSYLYRPTFVGREDQLSQISRVFSPASDGVGRCILIAGESGAGKTRLAMEVTQRAADQGFTVVTGDCLPVESATTTATVHASTLHPLRPLLRSIADYCRLRSADTTARILGERGKVLKPYEAGLVTLPGQETSAEPATLPAQAARARLLADLTTTVCAFAREVRLLLVLDDLQWADELTLAFLQSLGSSFYRGTPIVILGTYRSEESNPGLRELAQEEHVTLLPLGRLAPEEVEIMASDMLGLPRASNRLVEFVCRASEGNPFFLSEYLRAAVSGDLLFRDDRRGWNVTASGDAEEAAYQSLPLPRTLRELVGRRLVDMAPGAQLCLEGAAVLGREFDLLLAATLADLSEPQGMDAVSQLLARNVVEEIPHNRFRFAHDKLREVAYSQIPEERRRFLHERAAATLEARHVNDVDFGDLYGPLAHHWYMSGVHDKALEYLERAGEHALRIGAHQEARASLSRALDLAERTSEGVGPLRRARWLRLLGEACLGTGEIELSINHTTSALAHLGYSVPGGSAGWGLLLLGQTVRQAVHRIGPERSRGVAPATQQRLLEAAYAAGQLATTYYFRHHMFGALSHSLRCVNFAERARCAEVAALSYAQLGYVAGAIGLRRLARSYFGCTHALRGKGEDLTAFCAGLYFNAMYEMGLGNWEESERLGQEALDLLEQIANRQEAEVARTVVANTLYFNGRFRDAAARAQSMLESAQARANAQHSAWGAFLTGRSLLALGELAEARALLEQGHTMLVGLSDFVSLLMCEGLMAKALLLEGRVHEAAGRANTLMERIRKHGTVPLAQCLDGYSSLAEVYLSLWERESVRNVSAVRRSARQACRALRRFSYLFPMARPAALRTSAWERWLSGRAVAARRRWERALRAAQRLRMPYEEALVHQHLARVLGTHEGDRHRNLARELFAELGCSQRPGQLAIE